MNAVLAHFDASDRRLSRRLRAWVRPRWLRVWMTWASRLGDGWLWLAAVLVGASGGSRPRLLAAAAASAALSNAVIVVLKRRLRRPRPAPCEDRLFAFDQFSFPSGHTMNAFALGAILTLAWPQMAVPVLLVAVNIGASRVVLGFHFLSDVLAGALLGLLVGGAAYSILVVWR